MSLNPSDTSGARYLDAKLENATRGKRLRFSGFVSWPTWRARNVSLCSHTLADAVKTMHRMGQSSFRARLIQTALVSASAFVLSGNISLPTRPSHHDLTADRVGVLSGPTHNHTDFLLEVHRSCLDAFFALFHTVTQRCSCVCRTRRRPVEDVPS